MRPKSSVLPRSSNEPAKPITRRSSTTEGDDRWMPESADLVRYLQASYPQAA